MSNKIRDFLKGNEFKDEVTKQIEYYESFTWINSFMKLYGTKWFYEATIQGFMYDILFKKFSKKDYLFFLEQPYSGESMEYRSDLMMVDEEEQIHAIELKNNYDIGSVALDVGVLINNLENGNILYGYSLFFAENEAQINEWIQKIEEYYKVNKKYFDKSLFLIGIPWNYN